MLWWWKSNRWSPDHHRNRVMDMNHDRVTGISQHIFARQLLCMKQLGFRPTRKWLELLGKVKVKREVVGEREEWFGNGMYGMDGIFGKRTSRGSKWYLVCLCCRGHTDSQEWMIIMGIGWKWSVPSPSCATACGGGSLYGTVCVVVLWCYWVCVYFMCGACTCCVDVLRGSGAENMCDFNHWQLTLRSPLFGTDMTVRYRPTCTLCVHCIQQSSTWSQAYRVRIHLTTGP